MYCIGQWPLIQTHEKATNKHHQKFKINATCLENKDIKNAMRPTEITGSQAEPQGAPKQLNTIHTLQLCEAEELCNISNYRRDYPATVAGLSRDCCATVAQHFKNSVPRASRATVPQQSRNCCGTVAGLAVFVELRDCCGTVAPLSRNFLQSHGIRMNVLRL